MDAATEKFNNKVTVYEWFSLILQFFFAIISSFFKIFASKTYKSVKDEIVLITGGAQGLGKALALLYASEGATVIIWDVNVEIGQKTIEEISQFGYPQAYFFYCDVSNNNCVKKCAEIVKQDIGIVTILINNAGIMYSKPFLEWTQDEIEKQINVNLMSHHWTIQAFLPAMIKSQKGHIVAISSIAAFCGFAFHAPYCASKLAIKGMMHALYNEYSMNTNIKFTTVYPSGIDTNLTQKFVKRSPKQMWTKPEDAAQEIMFGQRAEMLDIGVPRSATYLCLMQNILPQKVQDVYLCYIRQKLVNALKTYDE